MNKNQTKISNIELLKEAMIRRSYSVNVFKLLDITFAQFIAPSGQVWLTKTSPVSLPFATQAVREISVNKYYAYTLVKSLGICIPRTWQVSSTIDSYSDMLQFQPLIVKPLDSAEGLGLTMNITNERELAAAIAHARTQSTAVLVQQQVTGSEIRFTILDGKVVAALHRKRPQVIGDGLSTLSQLIIKENNLRNEVHESYLKRQLVDNDLVDFSLKDMDYIPRKSEVIILSESVLVRAGASIYNVLESVHKSYIQTALKIAHALPTKFIAVDIMIEDYTIPQTKNNYTFIETSTMPNLHMYDLCRSGKNFALVDALAGVIDRHIVNA